MAQPDRDSYCRLVQLDDRLAYEAGKRLRTYKVNLLGLEVHELYSRDVKPTVATVTQVARSASCVTLANENLNRMGLMFYNDTAGACFVKLGAGASTTNFSFKLKVDELYVFPQPVYTGIVTGIWAAGGTANVMITELAESEAL